MTSNWRSKSKCPSCSGTNIERRNGAALESFNDITYEQCQSCGQSWPVKMLVPHAFAPRRGIGDRCGECGIRRLQHSSKEEGNNGKV